MLQRCYSNERFSAIDAKQKRGIRPPHVRVDDYTSEWNRITRIKRQFRQAKARRYNLSGRLSADVLASRFVWLARRR